MNRAVETRIVNTHVPPPTALALMGSQGGRLLQEPRWSQQGWGAGADGKGPQVTRPAPKQFSSGPGMEAMSGQVPIPTPLVFFCRPKEGTVTVVSALIKRHTQVRADTSPQIGCLVTHIG